MIPTSSPELGSLFRLQFDVVPKLPEPAAIQLMVGTRASGTIGFRLANVVDAVVNLPLRRTVCATDCLEVARDLLATRSLRTVRLVLVAPCVRTLSE
jgi:hypothetical protein